MDSGNRRQRWINYRRPQNGKPPHGYWHPKTVPSWEKDFCKVVGCFDWYTLVEMKKYMHFYDNVISWNDSAGEEAFHNAKRRYWAEIKGIQCDVPSPDPDLYIQNIEWNTEIAPDALDDLDSLPTSPKLGHDPVVIFGDMFYANQGFSPTGWGDAEEKPKVLVDHDYGVSYGQNLNGGESCDKNVEATGWTGWDDNYNNKNVAATGWTGCDDNNNIFYCGDSLGKKFGLGEYCETNVAASGWPDLDINNNHDDDDDDKNAWKYIDGDGACRMSMYGGWNGNDWGWLYEHNDSNNFVGPYVGGGRGSGGREYGIPGVQVHSDRKNHTWRGDKGRHNKGSYNRGRQDKRAGLREQGLNNSCQQVGQRAEMRVGEAWNRGKRAF